MRLDHLLSKENNWPSAMLNKVDAFCLFSFEGVIPQNFFFSSLIMLLINFMKVEKLVP